MFLAALGLGGCSDPEQAGEPRGMHVEFFIENDERTLCAGTVGHLDRYIERLFEFFDVSQDGFVAPVHVLVSPQCHANACYIPARREVHIQHVDAGGSRASGMLRHELSHAIIDRLWGQSVPFFNEGLAETLSQSLTEVPTPSLAPVGGMLAGEPFDIDYSEAARFVRFLIDTRGQERFRRLFQAAKIRSQEAVRRAIEDVYGESFDSLEAEYLSGAPRCQYQIHLCDELRAEPVGVAWSATQPVSCLDGDVYGSDDGERPFLATQRTVEVEHAGVYRLSAAAGFGSVSQIVLTRCGGCDEQFSRSYHFANLELVLEPGLYTLEFSASDEEVMTVDLEYVGDSPSP
ncbi:hypothetical protein SAMN02745121_06799 [Nannocystis exedens]|uniref:Peptidase MA superfamily protein n=2 Tax=Nannocystis exedens TaxID=54 RepID=A0A1I2FRN5_9BACT|nr:hypothetical protein [Nannocystis exedens]PCC73681.1 hypothetical protein NAEX_06769 [Nannocystis exedens]SFF08064.1 hypothetical protein SAMN02745121_06799 [Nannocystis exedens]